MNIKYDLTVYSLSLEEDITIGEAQDYCNNSSFKSIDNFYLIVGNMLLD